jgi:hypothetical protein
MKKFMFLIGAAAMLFATSCLNGSTPAGTSSASYVGKLTVYDTDSQEISYSDDEASVTIWIPNIIEPKFDIVYNGIKFDKMMPVKLNVELQGIPFTTTVSEDETTINYVFEAENIIPMVGSVAYEKYKIDKVEGCVGRTVDITFVMSSKGKTVHFTTATEEKEQAEI